MTNICAMVSDACPSSCSNGDSCCPPAGQSQASQSSAPVADVAETEAEKEVDDMPPIQNTLDSQPSAAEEDAKAAAAEPTPAPAGPSVTPQLPQQSLVSKLNEVAEEAPVLPKAVGTEDGSIAFVTTPGLAEGIQTTAEAAGATSPASKAGSDSPNPTASKQKDADMTKVGSPAAEQADQLPAKSRTSRAAKAAVSAKNASSAAAESGGKRVPSAEKKKACGMSAADSNNKENDQSAPATVGGQEANHMAVKEPHSRVEEAQGVKAGTPSGAATSSKKKKAAEGRDPLIGRCIKKDFETNSGLKTYTGWIIGKHPSKSW